MHFAESLEEVATLLVELAHLLLLLLLAQSLAIGSRAAHVASGLPTRPTQPTTTTAASFIPIHFVVSLTSCNNKHKNTQVSRRTHTHEHLLMSFYASNSVDLSIDIAPRICLSFSRLLIVRLWCVCVFECRETYEFARYK